MVHYRLGLHGRMRRCSKRVFKDIGGEGHFSIVTNGTSFVQTSGRVSKNYTPSRMCAKLAQ